MPTRDLRGKDAAWYRFTETPGRLYGPRELSYVFNTFSLRETCEVALAGPDGQPMGPWFPAPTLRDRLTSQAVQPRQLARLRELGVAFDPATIDKIGAMELLEQAELQETATASDLAEAQALGVTVVPGMTRAEVNRAMMPALEAQEADEDEVERLENNAEDITRLRRVGLTVARDVDDAQLAVLREALDRYTGAVEAAREMGLPASRVPKPREVADLATITTLLEGWNEVVPYTGPEWFADGFHLSRPPAQKLVRQLHLELFAAMQAGEVTPEGVDSWLLRRAAPHLGFVPKDAPSASVPSAPAPAVSRGRGSPMVWLAVILVGLYLLGRLT